MTESLGTVARCFRYPVKSLQGMEAASIDVQTDGVRGDRTFGLVDGTKVLSAKRTKALLDASATDTAITLPSGVTVAVDDPEVDAVLSGWLGRDIHLATPDEAGAVSYEMTFDPPDDSAEYYDIPTLTGSFLDLAPLHILTTASLDAAAAARPDLNWDVRRFRPNLVLDVPGDLFVEQDWLGRTLRIGAAEIRFDQPTVRCAMPLRAQPGGLDRQPGLFAALSELNTVFPNHFGIYATVSRPGPVAVGDPVELLAP